MSESLKCHFSRTDPFTVYTPSTSSFSDEFGDSGVGAVWVGMQNVVDELLTPTSTGEEILGPNYNSGFNNYTGEGNNTHGNGLSEGWPGYVTSQSAIDNVLYPDMGNVATRSFFAYAHGDGNILSDYNDDVIISAAAVAGALSNYYSSQIIKAKNPYRFVFLDGCSTASTTEWREAFGIYPQWAARAAVKSRIGPQAYVGWAKKVTGWLNPSSDTTENENVAFAYTSALGDMYELWRSGTSLNQCIYSVSTSQEDIAPLPVPNPNNVPYHIYGAVGTDTEPYNYNIPASSIITSPLYIVGHPGLTRTGLNVQADTDTHFNSPVDVQ